MLIINVYLNMFLALLCQKHVEIEVNNKHLIVASCWFFSLHTMMLKFSRLFSVHIGTTKENFTIEKWDNEEAKNCVI